MNFWSKLFTNNDNVSVELVAEVERLQEVERQANAVKSSLEAKLASLTAEKQQLESVLKEAQTKQVASAELETLQNEATTLRAENETLSAENEDLKAQLQSTQHKVSELQLANTELAKATGKVVATPKEEEPENEIKGNSKEAVAMRAISKANNFFKKGAIK